MAVNCEPVLACLGLSAYFAVNQFLQRLRDPQSRAFFDSNHDKISRFYRNCQDATRLLNENNPERRERLKRVLNGPVIFLFIRLVKTLNSMLQNRKGPRYRKRNLLKQVVHGRFGRRFMFKAISPE